LPVRRFFRQSQTRQRVVPSRRATSVTEAHCTTLSAATRARSTFVVRRPVEPSMTSSRETLPPLGPSKWTSTLSSRSNPTPATLRSGENGPLRSEAAGGKQRRAYSLSHQCHRRSAPLQKDLQSKNKLYGRPQGRILQWQSSTQMRPAGKVNSNWVSTAAKMKQSTLGPKVGTLVNSSTDQPRTRRAG